MDQTEHFILRVILIIFCYQYLTKVTIAAVKYTVKTIVNFFDIGKKKKSPGKVLLIDPANPYEHFSIILTLADYYIVELKDGRTPYINGRGTSSISKNTQSSKNYISAAKAKVFLDKWIANYGKPETVIDINTITI